MKTSKLRADRAAGIERELSRALLDPAVHKVKTYDLGSRRQSSASLFSTELIGYQRNQFKNMAQVNAVTVKANSTSAGGGRGASVNPKPAAPSFVFFTGITPTWFSIAVAQSGQMGGGGRGANIGVPFEYVSFAFFVSKTHKLDTGPNNVGGGGGGGQSGDLVEQPAPLTFDFFVPMAAPVFDPVAVAANAWSGSGGPTGGMDLPLETVTFEFFVPIVTELNIGPPEA
jgi:hypothetical protein